MTIELIRKGQSVILLNNEGGEKADIVETFDTTDFTGEEAQGDWTLKITDNAGSDVGVLNSWTLTIAE